MLRKLKSEAPGKGRYTKTMNWSESSDRLLWTASSMPWRFVLGGTRPHEIRAKGSLFELVSMGGKRHARALRFESNGQIVFARRVQHPGTKPNAFNVRAWRASITQLKPVLKEAARAGLTITQPNPHRVKIL